MSALLVCRVNATPFQVTSIEPSPAGGSSWTEALVILQSPSSTAPGMTEILPPFPVAVVGTNSMLVADAAVETLTAVARAAASTPAALNQVRLDMFPP